jgi:hypothetical protein
MLVVASSTLHHMAIATHLNMGLGTNALTHAKSYSKHG